MLPSTKGIFASMIACLFSTVLALPVSAGECDGIIASEGATQLYKCGGYCIATPVQGSQAKHWKKLGDYNREFIHLGKTALDPATWLLKSNSLVIKNTDSNYGRYNSVATLFVDLNHMTYKSVYNPNNNRLIFREIERSAGTCERVGDYPAVKN